LIFPILAEYFANPSDALTGVEQQIGGVGVGGGGGSNGKQQGAEFGLAARTCLPLGVSTLWYSSLHWSKQWKHKQGQAPLPVPVTLLQVMGHQLRIYLMS